ncbi:MAG TPA: hypothetical protein VKM94_19925 [Blastocatellia bacterium]|nr:hypothetical protein [Blastocatellia bacterium]
MSKRKLVILVLLIVVASTISSDAQQTAPLAEQLKLATAMPSGAMLYIQTRDLGGLMRHWLSSPVRKGYYDSKSFSAFSHSHLFLKLQDRKKDFETALGFGLDEQRLAELAGGPSALALYDIGKIELVMLTEMGRPRAVASTLFKHAPQFEERSAGGASYYVRQVTADGGRLNQQFCFAYSDGKLVITTTEGLMIRVLANLKSPGDDSLGSTIIKTAESADGFAAHDITMWLDQQKLNANRLFRSYWIHHNVDELATYESGLLDLRLSAQGISEQRWFKKKSSAQNQSEAAAVELSTLVRFAPADTQLVEVIGSPALPDELPAEVARVLFGDLPESAGPTAGVPGRTGSAPENSESAKKLRYGFLDNRFDQDVDDPDATDNRQKPGSTNAAARESGFDKNLKKILGTGASGAYATFARSSVDAHSPFVKFERGLVISLNSNSQVDRAALEKAISTELVERFVISGSQAEFRWEEEGGVRYVAQSLLEKGAAYAIKDNYLVLASSREFASDMLKVAEGTPKGQREAQQAAVRYASIRIDAAKPVFDVLMQKLDRPVAGGPVDTSDDQDSNRHIALFSENLSSMISALGFKRVAVTDQATAGWLREQVAYEW